MKTKASKTTSINRFERKWDIGGNVDTTAFLIAILRSNFMFTESYGSRNINTIYFDDIDCTSISENLDGLRFKKKYRLRWYGNSEVISKPQIEIKSKTMINNAVMIIKNSGKKYCKLWRLFIYYIAPWIIDTSELIEELTISTRVLGKTPNNKTKKAKGITVASSLRLISYNLSYFSFNEPKNTRWYALNK